MSIQHGDVTDTQSATNVPGEVVRRLGQLEARRFRGDRWLSVANVSKVCVYAVAQINMLRGEIEHQKRENREFVNKIEMLRHDALPSTAPHGLHSDRVRWFEGHLRWCRRWRGRRERAGVTSSAIIMAPIAGAPSSMMNPNRNANRMLADAVLAGWNAAQVDTSVADGRPAAEPSLPVPTAVGTWRRDHPQRLPAARAWRVQRRRQGQAPAG